MAVARSADVVRFFTHRVDQYAMFIRAVLYPQGLRAYFRAAPFLRSHLRVLDAGCGTGAVSFALRDAMLSRGFALGPMHAFDLTPAMLERFKTKLAGSTPEIELRQADVLRLDTLPHEWHEYDLIASASMLEYLPTAKLPGALAGLRSVLCHQGRLVVFMTRRNVLTRPLIGKWWASNLYKRSELGQIFSQAGFKRAAFSSFPIRYGHLAMWGHIVVASNDDGI
jgi:ubiquinone/menaquinone biosynthesis C-methylase UbiE